MDDKLSEGEFEELFSTTIIVEIAEKILEAFADKPEIIEKIMSFKRKAKEDMDELTEKRGQELIDLANNS